MTASGIALVPGGRSDDPAITWRGRTLTYAAFADLIDAARPGADGAGADGAGADGDRDGVSADGDRGGAGAGGDRDGTPLDVSNLPVPEALAGVFATARAGTAVLVRDPATAAPAIGALPPGTWLVAATSGSTGRPRAVCRTAASWAASIAPLADLTGLTSADRVLLTGPLPATLHLHAAVHTLAIGAELTDDPDRATAVHCVPAVLDTLLGTLPAGGPLRTAVVAGSALPDSLADRAAAQGIAVTEYYGAAELSFVAARRWPAPVLRPFPGVRVRLDETGLLWARSPYLALGYAGAAGPLRRDAAGYATVGDLAAAPDGDPAHGLVIRGRGETTVLTGGATVLVEDVQDALARLPGVRATAVIGVPHPRLGEVVTAVLELDDGTDLATVRAAAREVLAGAARPRRYVVVDALPRTGGGKIARAEIRRRLTAPSAGKQPPQALGSLPAVTP